MEDMNRKYITQEAEKLAKENQDAKETFENLFLESVELSLRYELQLRGYRTKNTVLWICLILVSSVLVYATI